MKIHSKLSRRVSIFILIGVFLPLLFSMELPLGKSQSFPSVTAKAIFAVN